jgi:hypothetical protein
MHPIAKSAQRIRDQRGLGQMAPPAVTYNAVEVPAHMVGEFQNMNMHL